MTRHTSFAPVVDARTRILILGSLPGAASLRAGRYYAHPRNQFWRLVGGVLGADLQSLPYGERLACLLQHGVGLWDVVADAERVGSLDGAIRAANPHDLVALMGRLPLLTTIGFNGGTAARIGIAQIGDAAPQLRLVALPSSSPAYTLSFERKLEAWRHLAPRNSTNDSAGLPSVP